MKKVLLHHDVRFSRDLAGYAASGLTQPTGTIGVMDMGKMPWQSFTSLCRKNSCKKVGWDKRSVPNMFVKEH